MRNIAKLALRLMIFSLAAGVLLAGVNALTEKPIAENLARKQNAGRAAVIGEYDFAPMEFDAQAYPNIAALYEARDGETVVGYVYELSTTGYAGEVLLSKRALLHKKFVFMVTDDNMYEKVIHTGRKVFALLYG